MDLNLANLINVLRSLDTNVRGEAQKLAEDQLKVWESVAGYHYLLQTVYLDQSLPLQSRWLAIICFKNGVEKYWRPTRVHAISKEEKVEIRSRLFDLINESSKQFAIQNAHAAARIARFDFPGEWPNLFDDITALIGQCARENNMVKLHNLLIILNQVIKALAAVRIGRTRVAMQTKAPEIAPLLINLYVSLFESWSKDLSLSTMEVGYVCLKTIRRLVADGFDYPHKNSELVKFFEMSLSNLQTLIIEYERQGLDLLERYIKCYTKMFLALATDNPTAFACLPSCKDTLMTYLSILESKAPVIYNSEEDDFWEQIAVRAFTILKRLVHFVNKKGALTLKQRSDKEEVQVAVSRLASEFFTQDLVRSLAKLIMTWYLKLRPKDLESWSQQPEEWVIEEMQMNWEFQIRPCAENVFQDLVMYFKDYLIDYVLDEISGGLARNNSLSDILQKDSVFSIFQLSSQVISERVDFDNLLNALFIPEGLKNDMLENKIIKRRICLIISEWLQIRCSKESRIEVYKLLLNFLDPSNPMNDKVVRLTAISTLMHAVDGWDFEKDAFRPYLEQFFTMLIGELNNMELTESKLFVLKVMSIVIELTNPLLSEEVLMRVMQIIPPLWESASDANDLILRTSVIRVLKSVVISLNTHSEKSYNIALPLIPVCCDERSEFYALLSEDGFELLQAVLQYSPERALPTQLAEMFPLVLKGLNDSTEILPLVISIIRSYALFGTEIFNSETGLSIFKVLSGYLPNLRDDSLVVFSSLFEIIMLHGQEQVVTNLVESGILGSMLAFVLDETQSPPSVVRILVPLLRFMCMSPAGFVQLLSRYTEATPATILNSLLNQIIQRLRNVGEPRIRKLALLSLFALYDEPQLLTSLPDVPSDDVGYNVTQLSASDGVSYVLREHIGPVLYQAIQAVEEVNEDENGNCEVYSRSSEYDNDELVVVANPLQEEEETGVKPSGERFRYTELSARDIVYTVPLKTRLKETLAALKIRFGEQGFGALTAKVDGPTGEQLAQIMMS